MLPDAVFKLGMVKLCWIIESVQKNFPVNVRHFNLVCSDRFLAFQQETLNQIFSNTTSRKWRSQFFFGEAFFKNNLKTKTTTTKNQPNNRNKDKQTNEKNQQKNPNNIKTPKNQTHKVCFLLLKKENIFLLNGFKD